MPMNYSIRGENTDTLELDIYDDITSYDYYGVSARQVRATLKNSKAKTIKLRVNSAGGDVFEGFAIHNLLLASPARVEADVDGLAASIASVIVMAADEVRMGAGSMMMIHRAWSITMGDQGDMQDMATLLGKIDGQVADIYAKRTGQTRDAMLALMDAETWMTADEAVAGGFADKVAAAVSARALAGLDISGFQNAPQIFAQSLQRARVERVDAKLKAKAEETARNTPNDSAGAPRAGVDEKPAQRAAEENHMLTLDEIKQKHPDLYAQIVALGRELGAKEERERCSAHLEMGEQCGDLSIAVAAIKEGTVFGTPLIQAKYMGASMRRRDVTDRQADSDAAGAALNNAQRTPEPAAVKDMGDILMERDLAARKKNGRSAA